MNSQSLLRRIIGVTVAIVASTIAPEALKAACINQTNPITGIQTITCCGATACCTSTWRGSELLELICD